MLHDNPVRFYRFSKSDIAWRGRRKETNLNIQSGGLCWGLSAGVAANAHSR